MANTAARKRSRRRFLELACICLAVALLGWFVVPQPDAAQSIFYQSDVLFAAERMVQDKIVAWSGAHPAADNFVFVAIDDPSLKMEFWPEDIAQSPALVAMSQGWPWPRAVYADALDRIFAAGARLVMFDLILDAAKPGDERLKAALDRYASKVVIGANLSLDTLNPDHPELAKPTMRVPAPSLIAQPETDPRVGFVNFFPESDQKIRSALYHLEIRTQAYQSLAAAAARQLGHDTMVPTIYRPFLFRFVDLSKLTIVPFYTLFLPQAWGTSLKNGAVFKDKIVVIGPSAAIMHDVHLVPDGVQIPGPLLHVNALASVLSQNFYTRAGVPINALCIVIAALVTWLLTIRLARRPIFALGTLLGACAALLIIAYLLVHWLDYLLPVVQPGSVLLVGGVICIAWNFAQERRESGRMRSTLERYVSRNVVREILDNRDDFLNALGGKRQPVTVFFSDVRGFTSFSERLDPHSVVEQLNEYLGEMVGVIFRHEGTVDKFMGDGIMAVWGNVVSKGAAADATQAVNAALEMLDRLAGLNERWAARGLPPFAIGIGLHHGEAVFANIGSAEKMEPTVIGDTVNLASRVEGLTKKYGVTLCITHPLAELVADKFLFRSVDLVQVVGKSRPVEIVTVIGRRGEALPEWLKCYEGGVADFRARRFAEAAAQFRLSLQATPDDKLCKIYLARCEAFLVEPPPEDWTGTEIATSK